MSRPVGVHSTDLRYREDTGFERRCESCTVKGGQCFWPVTLEFWDPSSLRQCRACYRGIVRRRARERYRLSEAERSRRRRANAKWRSDIGRAARHLKNAERWERTRERLETDPVFAEEYRARRRRGQAA